MCWTKKIKESDMDEIKSLDLMKVTFKKSPNQSQRIDQIKYIVLHHTGPGSFSGISKWLRNKKAKASAHYIVGTEGQLHQLVNSRKKSWHAGISSWNGLSDINKYSIGIEIQNIGRMERHDDGNYYYEFGRGLKKYDGDVEPAYGKIIYPDGQILEGYYVPYPKEQINKVIALCKGLIKKYPQIDRESIIAHYQISPGRKNDPFGLCVDYLIEQIFS